MAEAPATDTIAAEFQKQWEKLNIRVDRTIRTTDPRHHKKVQWLFQRCVANGFIHKGSYTGQYCVYDELYVNDAKPGDNLDALLEKAADVVPINRGAEKPESLESSPQQRAAQYWGAVILNVAAAVGIIVFILKRRRR